MQYERFNDQICEVFQLMMQIYVNPKPPGSALVHHSACVSPSARNRPSGPEMV